MCSVSSSLHILKLDVYCSNELNLLLDLNESLMVLVHSLQCF
uniref:Uncharacterized protein n=1 Tax=Anguilla anguilla TaxID=7936 RepID=A0A0E9PM75_ANGAN